LVVELVLLAHGSADVRACGRRRRRKVACRHRAGRFGAILTPPVDEDQPRVNEHEPVKEALDAASIAGLSE
jgi:hypothetical protein